MKFSIELLIELKHSEKMFEIYKRTFIMALIA